MGDGVRLGGGGSDCVEVGGQRLWGGGMVDAMIISRWGNTHGRLCGSGRVGDCVEVGGWKSSRSGRVGAMIM